MTPSAMGDEDSGSEPAGRAHEPTDEAADHIADPVEPALESAADNAAEHAADDERETAEQKKARLDAALRSYRATLRNEAETGNEGFSADYYKSQKPPHW